MEKLVIIGAGGFGRETSWLVERINRDKPKWDLLGFIDNAPELIGSMVGGYPVLGDDSWLSNNYDVYAVCAIGSPGARKKTVEKNSHVRYTTLIDPDVILSEHISIGAGSIICAGSILTVDVVIGSHVIVNLDCTIGHDSVLGDFVTLYPSVNISGQSTIGEAVEMGTGSMMIQGLNVGEQAIIGAGSVIVRNIPPRCTAVGCPSVPIKYHDS